MSDFDFEEFIAGARLAEDTFALFLVNYGPRIAHLKEQIAAASQAGDEREATSDSGVADLEAQVADLVSKMHESKRELTLRALTPEEWDAHAGTSTDVYDQLASQSVSPKLDRDQWKRLGAAAGAVQFGEFLKKANVLAAAQVVVPDFSPTSSTSQDQRESSVN